MSDPGRDAACALVWERFPHLQGTRPVIQRAGTRRVYVFSASTCAGPGGKSVQQVVRVTVDADGEVVKVAASR